MKTMIAAAVMLLVGFGLGYGFFFATTDATVGTPEAGADEPLYWVAPMDPNFRRDAPGKSPMGMDLVPVYAEDRSGEGEVMISPAVAHNIGVRTAAVRRGKLKDTIKTVGHVDYDENRVYGVHPRVEGWLTRLNTKSVGEPVAAGEALYDLYSPALVNAQEEYLTAWLSGSQSLIDSASARLKSYNVSDALMRELERTERVQQSVTFLAPHDGIVRSIDVAEGAYVNPGSRLMTIADLSRVWVTAEIFETDVARVEAGNEMRFETAFDPGQIRAASIDFVYPMLEAMTRTLQVRATVDNSDRRLRPNMFTEMTIPLESEEETLLVPRSSVIRTQDVDRVVIVTDSGGYQSVAVTVGRSGNEETEILEGLRETDRVVTSAQFLIDSESSKSADFQRMSASMDHSQMDHSQMDHSQMNHGEMDHSAHGGGRDVWVNAAIRSINREAGTISLTHEPIPSWNWPTMTMMMNAGDAVDLNTLEQGKTYRIHMMEAPDSTTGYVVMHVEPAESASSE